MSATLKRSPALIISAAICAFLLILFASLSFDASLSKSAVYDEPLHLLGGYVHRQVGDFRINPEDPALFGFIAALPLRQHEIKLTFDTPLWQQMPDDFSRTQWAYAMNLLYRYEDNNADAALHKSRFMFVLIGVALGALIAWWGWRLGGALTASLALALFSLDPNFLAHAALVKNDVPFALLTVGLAIAMWQFGRRGGWVSLVAIALICAIAANIKYSATLLGPIVFLTLCVRALLPEVWTVLGLSLNQRWKRLLVAPAVCGVVAIACYIAIWACYGFRFSPTPDPAIRLNSSKLVAMIRMNRMVTRYQIGEIVPQEILDREPIGVFAESILWIESHQLLPQAWTEGLLYTYATTLKRGCYLLGEVGNHGWWYYFPLAMLFKTPTATLLAIFAAAGYAVFHLFRNRNRVDWWTILAVSAPAAIYGIMALSTNMNIGVRHILPMYPLIYLGIALTAVMFIRARPRAGLISVAVLLLGISIETFAAYPNFIAFFNAPSGGERGGLRLLGDSNLDWGQDLPLLAKWRKAHPMKRLYLNYFGIADPEYYGITATYMQGGWQFAEAVNHPDPGEDCYLAISATNLQGIFYGENDRANYQQLLAYKPIAILGGTIYIYDLPIYPGR